MRVVVVGGSRGIGNAVATAYARRGAAVVATGTGTAPPAGVHGNIRFVPCIDVRHDGAIEVLASAVGAPVDVLVCSAGINTDGSSIDEITMASLEEMIEVNALGAARTILGLLPLMNWGSKIAIVTSGGISVLNVEPDAPRQGFYGYTMSKAAITSFGHGIAPELRKRGIAVLMASPGPVDTELLHEVVSSGRVGPEALEGAMTVAEAGEWFRAAIEDLELDQSPRWITRRGQVPIRAEAGR